MNKLRLILLLLLPLTILATNEYILTDFPTAILSPDDPMWIKWTGMPMLEDTTQVDSGTIYFSKEPGGQTLSNYPYSVDVMVDDNTITDAAGNYPERGIQFIPSEQTDMTPGLYYLVVAHTRNDFFGNPVTYISNEIQFVRKSTETANMISPVTDAETDPTPLFRWDEVVGVPYYHLIVSDEKINLTRSRIFP